MTGGVHLPAPCHSERSEQSVILSEAKNPQF